jgi:hypothetical protein
MPSGQTSTLLNRKPIYVGDDTVLSSVLFSTVGPGTTAPSLKNQVRHIIPLTAATTLTAAQSGALCVWTTATGCTATLPAPVIGLWYEFLVAVTNTATACKIITDAATTFIGGSPLTYINNTTPGATAGPKGFLYDSAASVACVMGGSDTTAGGIAGSRVRLTCVSATLWIIEGNIVGAGTIVTSASAS